MLYFYYKIGGRKMLKNKKGFTLVELLAVIVILAIILAIAVPGISGIISSAQKGAFESDVKMILTGIEYKITEHTINDTVTLPVTGDITANLADYGGTPANYTSFTITITGGAITDVDAVSSTSGEFGSTSYTAAGTRSNLSITTTP
jgi:type IV pilus assembly protein PilA